jgi:hypothetical protein
MHLFWQYFVQQNVKAKEEEVKKYIEKKVA